MLILLVLYKTAQFGSLPYTLKYTSTLTLNFQIQWPIVGKKINLNYLFIFRCNSKLKFVCLI
jgi:hypothetical protein